MPVAGFVSLVSICQSDDRRVVVVKMRGRDVAQISAAADGTLHVEPLIECTTPEQLEKDLDAVVQAFDEALAEELGGAPPRPGERPA